MNTFALPDETRVSRVELRSANLDRLADFYQGVLGFSAIDSPGARTGFGASPTGPVLIAVQSDPAAHPPPARSTGLYHLAVRYPTRQDLAHALQRLLRNRYAITGASDHLVSEAIYLDDPDQNGVELYVDRPRSQWVWRNDQVTMSTEPLDLDDLLATAPENTGTVPPAPGTDLGHIHLHVADLTAAERFYREFLGLAVTQRSYPGALFLSAGQYHHHVAVNTWAGKTPAGPGRIGLVSYRLEVPVREILYCLEQRAPLLGYEAQRVESSPDLLRIRDPNGHTLEVQWSADATTGDHRGCPPLN